VAVAIQHPYTCDLIVSLRSPSGTSTTLADSDSCSRSNPNLNLQLDSRQGGPLTSLVGQSVDGTWTLQVVDNTGVDVGSLTSWSITAET
jgi:subtilisin-like proprotein convertase family protein